MFKLITLTLLSLAQANQVIYSNQMLPYCPVHLSDGTIAYPTKVVQHTFPIPQGCTKWSDGCTECTVFNGALRHCNTNPHCKFTSCLPVCTEFHEVRRIPEDCNLWQDSCQHTCDITAERTQYISTINGRRFIRDIYKNIQHPCTDYKWCVWQGHCARRRTCALATHLHAEAQTKYMAFDPVYTGMGYNSAYVPTVHTSPYTQQEMVVPDGSMYYAPKVAHVMSNDLQHSYSNIIQNQYNNLMQHQNSYHQAEHMKEAKVQSHVLESEIYSPFTTQTTGHKAVHQNTYAVSNNHGQVVTQAFSHDTSMAKSNVPTYDTMHNMPISSQHSYEVAKVAHDYPVSTTVATSATHAMPVVHGTTTYSQTGHDMGIGGMGGVYGYGYDDPYQWEHEKNMLDQLQYRINSGGMNGYYYNPYPTHTVYDSQPNVHNAPTTYMDAYGNMHTPLATASTVNDGASAASEEAEDELSDGEIAGIAVGSVVGFILLSCLFYFCLCNDNNMGRRGTQTQMVEYSNQRMGPPRMDIYNSGQSDMTGVSDFTPDILDYQMQKNYNVPNSRRKQQQMY